MFYVYLLKNELSKTYLGSTNNLRRRFQEHNTNKSTATRGHTWKLVYYEAYGAESDARRRESALKNHGQALAQLKRRISDSLVKT
jgi:predicted GIY-YIG superfamily endonuclease